MNFQEQVDQLNVEDWGDGEMANENAYINPPILPQGQRDFLEQANRLGDEDDDWGDGEMANEGAYINPPILPQRQRDFIEQVNQLRDEDWEDDDWGDGEIGYVGRRNRPVLPVPRLEVLSLRKVWALVKVEFNRRGEMMQNELKAKAQMLWRMTINIIKSSEPNGSEVIRLMRKITYFDSDIIHEAVFRYRRIIHDEQFVTNSELLRKLKDYGLIGHVSIGYKTHYCMHSPLLVEVIQSQSELIEMDLLRDCIKHLRRPTYCDPFVQANYLRAVWDRAMKYMDLVRKYKTVGINMCKTLYRPPYNSLDTSTSIIVKTLEKFQGLLTSRDPAMIWLRCAELGMLVSFFSIKKETELGIYDTILIKCQNCRLMIDEYTSKKSGQEDILNTFRRAAIDIKRIAGFSPTYKKRLLEEALKMFELLHTRRRDVFEYNQCFPLIVSCLTELNRTGEILVYLREIRRIIVKNKYKMYRRLSRNYICYLYSIPGCILDSRVLNFGTKSRESRRLEKALLMELRIILEFGLVYLKQTQKNKKLWFSKREFFPDIIFYLVTCLVKLEKFDQILATVKQADVMWTDSLEVRFVKMQNPFSPGLDVKEHFVFPSKKLTLKYFGIHCLVFKMAATNKRLNYELKVEILNQLLVITKALCSCSLQNDIYLTCPWSEDSAVILVIQSFLELDKIDELIIYSKEYETLLESRFGYKEPSMVKAMLAFGDKQIQFLKPMPNRVEYFPLIEAIKLSARRYGRIILKYMRNNLSMRKTAMEIIEVCDRRLQSEPHADLEVGNNWSWGSTWFEHEKQEMMLAKKLFYK